MKTVQSQLLGIGDDKAFVRSQEVLGEQLRSALANAVSAVEQVEGRGWEGGRCRRAGGDIEAPALAQWLGVSLRQDLGDTRTLRLGPLAHDAAWLAIEELIRRRRAARRGEARRTSL